jgi:hypothetical protein
VRSLRAAGEIVVCSPAGHQPMVQAFQFDRELVLVQGRWALQAMAGDAAPSRHTARHQDPALSG